MPRTYPQGVTCRVHLETPDATAVAPFSADLLGWSLDDAMPAAAPGHSLIATLDGQDAAAIASGAASIGADPAWSTSIAVDDADAMTVAVAEAGGEVVAAPADTPGGRVAVCRDPQGALFRLRQAGRRLGAQVANVPGAWNFSDLRTDDPAGAARFYGGLFGWRVADLGPDAGAIVQVPGYGAHIAGGADPQIFERQRAAGAPEGFADAICAILPVADGEAPHWHVAFSVADRDESAALAGERGGAVESTREGAWALAADLRDPAGARFSVSQLAPR